MKKILELLCGLLAGTALFAIMALTFFDVLGRKFLSNSIPGSLELTELLMVVVIFGALPLVSERGEHVEFDSLDPFLPLWLRRLQAVLVHVLCAAALFGLAYVMWGSAGQFLQNGETTAQLKILKAPFLYGMSVLCAATAVIHLFLVAQPPAQRMEGEGVAL
ncbi:TRAP transporter small permease [Caenimonas sedimenti]|uniref:TRAP transporter small permease protein n=1 Tax=Caenimonas sedimenti TaxID=2596921 RepID=A0A562ZY21_9BURK|nr:TRAP transporter small permease [Caenimonas sedimenti]TWO73238.1 TRAP transporter small permease [Caenimonas sedimenti]